MSTNDKKRNDLLDKQLETATAYSARCKESEEKLAELLVKIDDYIAEADKLTDKIDSNKAQIAKLMNDCDTLAKKREELSCSATEARLAYENLCREQAKLEAEYDEACRAIPIMTAEELKDKASMVSRLPNYLTKSLPIETVISAFGRTRKVIFGNIEWRVLALCDECALLISDRPVCQNAFSDKNGNTDWESSFIRKWLNDDFYNKTFSDTEKSKMLVSTLRNDSNAEYGTGGGADTADKLFLLSIEEADEYFMSNGDRVAVDEDSTAKEWWLRSNGLSDSHIAVIKSNGEISYRGNSSTDSDGCVRPAFRIKL